MIKQESYFPLVIISKHQTNYRLGGTSEIKCNHVLTPIIFNIISKGATCTREVTPSYVMSHQTHIPMKGCVTITVLVHCSAESQPQIVNNLQSKPAPKPERPTKDDSNIYG